MSGTLVFALIVAILMAVLLFLLGVALGGNLEKQRFKDQYPMLGRIRVGMSNGKRVVKIDYTIDLEELGEYSACRMYIAPLTNAPDYMVDPDDEESMEELEAKLDEASKELTAMEGRDV